MLHLSLAEILCDIIMLCIMLYKKKEKEFLILSLFLIHYEKIFIFIFDTL